MACSLDWQPTGLLRYRVHGRYLGIELALRFLDSTFKEPLYYIQ
jgi:hypothetical protein